MKNKTERIESFKKLLAIAKSHSVKLFANIDDYHKGERTWPIEWEDDLGQGCFKTRQDRQSALDRTLERFVGAELPDSVEQMKK